MDFFGMDMPSVLSVLALAVLIAVFFIVRRDKSYDSVGPVSISSLKKKSPGPENRQHPRLDISWPLTMDTSSGKAEGTLTNISMGGAFIACSEPLYLYERFSFTINLPEAKGMVINAEVLWSNVNVADDMIQTRGMGIRFVDNTDDVRAFLNHTIDALAAKGQEGETATPVPGA